MRHAYIRLEKSGDISIRWWVDGAKGLASREVILVAPGESAFGIPHDVWVTHVGAFVDLDEVGPTSRERPSEN